MVSNKKMDRALNGPGMFEIVFGVILSLVLGVLLAALHLVFKPVEVAKKPPESPTPGQVYMIEGSVNSGKARQWTRKRQMLADGAAADVTFNEEELNAWMASATPQPQKGALESADATYIPEKVNFRIQGGVLQVGLLGKVVLLGMNRDLVFHTRGTFVEGGGGYEFSAEELYVGSLPTHKVPGLTPFLIKRAMAAQALPEDLMATWKKLKLVAVEDDVLRLVLP
jgi:hypothetical protein